MTLLRIDRFAKGVLFAALAALAAVVGVLVGGPVIGAGPAISTAFAGLALAWLFAIAPTAAGGFKAALVSMPLLGGLLVVAPYPSTTALACTALIAVGRGVFLRPGPVARTVVVEGLVAVGAVGLASAFVPGGLTGLGLAVWGYFLVQSLPLLTAATRDEKATVEADAFAAAMNRAERILSR